MRRKAVANSQLKDFDVARKIATQALAMYQNRFRLHVYGTQPFVYVLSRLHIRPVRVVQG